MTNQEPIEIGNLLQVLPGGLIRVPHCEPPSMVSTLRFAAYYAESNCEGALIRIEDALAALPGSEIIYGVNFGPPNHRTRWFRLPPTPAICPCPGNVDWYAILRNLPKVQTEEEPGPCSLEVDSWCCDEPKNPPDAPNTYFEAGEFPTGVGFLPPITPNQRD